MPWVGQWSVVVAFHIHVHLFGGGGGGGGKRYSKVCAYVSLKTVSSK